MAEQEVIGHMSQWNLPLPYSTHHGGKPQSRASCRRSETCIVNYGGKIQTLDHSKLHFIKAKSDSPCPVQSVCTSCLDYLWYQSETLRGIEPCYRGFTNTINVHTEVTCPPHAKHSCRVRGLH